MGVSVFPAPSTSTSVPGASNKPPKFTYNNSYTLSSLTGLNAIDGTSTAMTYRRTDGCIYFVGSGNTNLWKFNTSTNTGSYVGNNLSWTGWKDINAAYDGTLYASYSLGSNTSIETPQYSTDAGVTWNYLTSATSGDYRGFMTLFDDGTFPNVTGNSVTLQNGGTANGATAGVSTWWLNNVRMGSNTTYQSGNNLINYNGGRGIFPLRDGDDVKTTNHCIWLGGTTQTGATSYEVSRGTTVAMRYALASVRNSAPTNSSLAFIINPTSNIAWHGTNGAVESMFAIGKPTSIDSRWIVGAHSGSTNALQVIDFQTASTANSVPLPTITDTNHLSYGSYCANPIYVSATKKLYVLQMNGNGSANSTRMHVYDVTTY